MRRSELNQINQELDYIEEIFSNEANRFSEFEQEQASLDLEQIIENLEATYKQKISEKIIQIF